MLSSYYLLDSLTNKYLLGKYELKNFFTEDIML